MKPKISPAVENLLELHQRMKDAAYEINSHDYISDCSNYRSNHPCFPYLHFDIPKAKNVDKAFEHLNFYEITHLLIELAKIVSSSIDDEKAIKLLDLGLKCQLNKRYHKFNFLSHKTCKEKISECRNAIINSKRERENLIEARLRFSKF